METRTWREMRERMATLLVERTGQGVEAWNARVASADPADRAALRAWLADQGVSGYAADLLVMERFGYPDFLVASASALLDAQYAERGHLRPILDAVVLAAQGVGATTVQLRKTYVALVGPRRQFAVVQPTTRSRVDLGLRLDGMTPAGRLLAARGVGNDRINLRIALSGLEDVDAEVLTLLEAAYRTSL